MFDLDLDLDVYVILGHYYPGISVDGNLLRVALFCLSIVSALSLPMQQMRKTSFVLNANVSITNLKLVSQPGRLLGGCLVGLPLLLFPSSVTHFAIYFGFGRWVVFVFVTRLHHIWFHSSSKVCTKSCLTDTPVVHSLKQHLLFFYSKHVYGKQLVL